MAFATSSIVRASPMLNAKYCAHLAATMSFGCSATIPRKRFNAPAALPRHQSATADTNACSRAVASAATFRARRKYPRAFLKLGQHPHPARDHGLQMIHPNPLPGAEGRYVVLNSGHTYHDSELRFSYMVFPRLGDWAILKVGENPPNAPASKVAETVLDSGFFDEAWKFEK